MRAGLDEYVYIDRGMMDGMLSIYIYLHTSNQILICLRMNLYLVREGVKNSCFLWSCLRCLQTSVADPDPVFLDHPDPEKNRIRNPYPQKDPYIFNFLVI